MVEDMWSELPPEILEQIFRRLTFPDTRRFAAVCRQWRTILEAEPPRLGFGAAPWLMVSDSADGPDLPKRARRIGGKVRRFFDPLERTYYEIEAPDFARSVCHAAVRDWLLLSVCIQVKEGEGSWQLFFFNPFTKARLDLPESHSPFDLALCSVVPTCTDCVVLLITKGVTEVTTTVIQVHKQENQAPVVSYTHQTSFELEILDAVYCGGLFYLFGISWMGRVLCFNPKTGSLQHLINMFSALSQPMSINLVESLGNVLVITRGDTGGGWCRVYRLDFSAKAFTNASEELVGQVLLLGAGTSMAIPAIGGLNGSTIYFGKCGTFEGGMCEMKKGSNMATLSPLDDGLYGLPEKRVTQWPASLSDDSIFADNLDCLYYIRVPRIHAFADSSGEWYATGGNEGIWVQAPLY